MGLFDIFRKKTLTETPTSFNSLPFSDFIKLDLSALLEKAVVINRHVDIQSGEFKFIDYESFLENPVLKIFNTIQIRLHWEEKEIREDLNLTFLLKGKSMTIQEIAFIVNSIAEICKVSNDNWTNVDEMRINSGIWRGRSFFLDTSLVSIYLDNDYGVVLSIAGFKNFKEFITS